MKKRIALCLAAFLGVALLSAPAASAGGQEVIRRGTCSAASTWKLKLKLDDGRIEVEFEVDQNRVGRRWNVALRRNGVVAFSGTRTTLAPSGSFEVRRLLGNGAGVDRVVARARARATGEVCRGVASI
jgi:hypothetical protein